MQTTKRIKKLDQFPKLIVTSVRRGPASNAGPTSVEFDAIVDASLSDRFEEIAKGESVQWFWLLHEKAHLCPMLKSFDSQTGVATLICYEGGEPTVGSGWAYLSPYWQAFHVWMVLDPDWGWEMRQYQGNDAVAEDYEANQVSFVEGREVKVWTKLEPVDGGRGQSRHYPAESQIVPVSRGTRLIPGGWGHEHCELCNKHIDPGDLGYSDPAEHWICENCYLTYVAKGNLAFVDDL
jgi:hypothetical protein